MQEELRIAKQGIKRILAKGPDVLSTPYPTMCFTLPLYMYKQREDGSIELRMSLPLAKAFANMILCTCEEEERKIIAEVV